LAEVTLARTRPQRPRDRRQRNHAPARQQELREVLQGRRQHQPLEQLEENRQSLGRCKHRIRQHLTQLGALFVGACQSLELGGEKLFFALRLADR
jgi:hypothetical protein